MKPGRLWLGNSHVVEEDISYYDVRNRGYAAWAGSPAPRARIALVSGGAAIAAASTVWADNTAYALGLFVTQGGNTYMCTTAHTSHNGTNKPGVDGSWQLVWQQVAAALDIQLAEVGSGRFSAEFDGGDITAYCTPLVGTMVYLIITAGGKSQGEKPLIVTLARDLL